jgi:hypothetical protein
METVARQMGHAIPLFYPIVTLNRDSDNQYMFFDVENGSIVGGVRRVVSNRGVMFFRAQYARGAEVDLGVGPRGIMHENGLYHYRKETYDTTTADTEGILGDDVNDGKERERIRTKEAIDYINAMKEKTALKFNVDLSPNDIHEFVNDHFTGFQSSPQYQDRKINIQFTAGVPVGHLAAMAEKQPNNEIIMVSEFEFKGKLYTVKSFVDKDSIINAERIRPGLVYLIRPMNEDKQAGVKTCNVLQPLKTGIRIAVQHFDRGMLRAGHGSYEVNKSDTNNVKYIMDHPFMPDYNDKWIQGAPMLTFDLDLFSALMNTLKGYPRISMQFADAYSGGYFYAEGHNEHPTIEAAIAPTYQHIRGRIWIP